MLDFNFFLEKKKKQIFEFQEYVDTEELRRTGKQFSFENLITGKKKKKELRELTLEEDLGGKDEASGGIN